MMQNDSSKSNRPKKRSKLSLGGRQKPHIETVGGAKGSLSQSVETLVESEEPQKPINDAGPQNEKGVVTTSRASNKKPKPREHSASEILRKCFVQKVDKNGKTLSARISKTDLEYLKSITSCPDVNGNLVNELVPNATLSDPSFDCVAKIYLSMQQSKATTTVRQGVSQFCVLLTNRLWVETAHSDDDVFKSLLNVNFDIGNELQYLTRTLDRKYSDYRKKRELQKKSLTAVTHDPDSRDAKPSPSNLPSNADLSAWTRNH